jgi:putative hydrolase of the HAD superfamily
MRPILVTNANYPTAAAYRDDPDTHVPDLAVDEVSAILTLVCQDPSCP